jgi:uncharacterized protein
MHGGRSNAGILAVPIIGVGELFDPVGSSRSWSCSLRDPRACRIDPDGTVRRLMDQTWNMVTDERANEYDRMVQSIAAWALEQPDIVGAAVVGSWARAAAEMDSDIDVVVLTGDKVQYVTTEDWIGQAVPHGGDIVRTLEWGPLTERRVRLGSGLEIEFGFAGPSWATTDPVDPGTARVILGGCTPIVDQCGLFERLFEATGQQACSTGSDNDESDEQ